MCPHTLGLEVSSVTVPNLAIQCTHYCAKMLDPTDCGPQATLLASTEAKTVLYTWRTADDPMECIYPSEMPLTNLLRCATVFLSSSLHKAAAGDQYHPPRRKRTTSGLWLRVAAENSARPCPKQARIPMLRHARRGLYWSISLPPRTLSPPSLVMGIAAQPCLCIAHVR